MIKTKLKPYMLSGGDPEDGALLAFALAARQAKTMFWGEVAEWCSDIKYTDIRVIRMRNDQLYRDGDALKLAQNTPHSVDSPTGCKVCRLWGEELGDDGLCEGCHNHRRTKCKHLADHQQDLR